MKYRAIIIAMLTMPALLYIHIKNMDTLLLSISLAAVAFCVYNLSQLKKAKLAAKHARDELIEKTRKLDTMFGHSALGTMVADKSGQLLDANPKFLEMLGYSLEELKTLSFIDLTFPEDREKDKELYEQAVKKKLPYSKEKRYRRKNGEMFIGKLSASFVLGDDGEPMYAIAHVEDITKEKLLEKDLKESQKRYRDLVAYSPEPIIVHRDGVIIFANEKACRMVGMSMEELHHKSIYDFISPDYHSRTRERLDELQNVVGEEETRNFKIIIPGGRKLTIEITHKAIEYEGLPSIQATFRDVTERNRLEKDLRKATERYRFITENSKDVISFLDSVGRYDYISSASRDILGYEPDELIGKNVFSFVHEDDAPELERAQLENLIGVNDHFSLIYRHRLKDGSYRWIDTVAKVLLNEKGEIDSFLAISRDATERKEKEKSLETANDFLKLLSSLDGLTGISNRRYFEENLEKEWERNKANETPLSAIMLDIDCFKLYNDTFGHLAGDDCLKKVASVIRDSLKRPRDLAARYGGEEFIILLPETDKAGAMLIAETIRQSVRKQEIPHTSSEIDSYITISAGYATIVPDEQFEPKDLIREADIALYQAKRNGKNKVSSKLVNSPL
ncbi:PAS domain S-box protein [Neobacillus sp. YIM B06451]|uniref:GGDEF domain-containing protein n=1 Tax=Neobacillus sp. YIM B06451 TaxID=3070994 RepID=UPI0029304F01|nr:PAS domain S-box protein [Neobacillus sp. YIM B06451]